MGDTAGWGEEAAQSPPGEGGWEGPTRLDAPSRQREILSIVNGAAGSAAGPRGASGRVSSCTVATSLTLCQGPQAGGPRSRPAPHTDAPCSLSLTLLPREPVSRLRRCTASRVPRRRWKWFWREAGIPRGGVWPQRNGLEQGSCPDPWVVEGAVLAPRWARPPMPSPAGLAPSAPPELQGGDGR